MRFGFKHQDKFMRQKYLKTVVSRQLPATSFCRGQSLIEVVVSMAVVVAVAISLITATLVTQKSSKNARNNTMATKLVQEGLEEMRVFRDRKGFISLPPGSATTCWVLINTDNDPSTWGLKTLPDAPCPETVVLSGVSFSRTINVEDSPAGNASEKKVTVKAIWGGSGDAQTVSDVTYLSSCVTAQYPC